MFKIGEDKTEAKCMGFDIRQGLAIESVPIRKQNQNPIKSTCCGRDHKNMCQAKAVESIQEYSPLLTAQVILEQTDY